MSAVCGFGISGGLAWDATLEAKLAAMKALTSGYCREFYEVIDFGKPEQSVWHATWDKTGGQLRQLRDQDVPVWKFWVPQNTDNDVNRILKFWSLPSGGSLSYDDWSAYSVDIFLPGYMGREHAMIAIPGTDRKWSLGSIEQGISMTEHLIEEADEDEKDYYDGMMEAFRIAQEAKFLVVISG
jgi:hypothetical protein